MGKLWDALKKADREGDADYVGKYEGSIENPPADYAGDFDLHLTTNMAEEYRKLMKILGKLGQEKNQEIKMLMVTSSSAGEGTTTIAASLAAGIAKDKRNSNVLLIDANLRNPGVHAIFNLMPAPGLIEVVTDFENRREFLRASPIRLVPNLNLLTAGNTDIIDSNPLEILESKRLITFLDELRGAYDLVVLDCPPVNPFSDALSLAPHIDGIILVVDSEASRWEVVDKAQENLDLANANLLGVVLNKRKLVIPKSIYKRL